jgi:hypothetical protein
MLDELLQNGYTITEFSLRSTQVVLRSRFAWEDQIMFQRLDRAKLDTALAYQQMFTLLSIAASLVKYGEHTFPPQNVDLPAKSDKDKGRTKSKDLDERIEFIESLPTVITDILYQKWHSFNQKHGYIVSNLDALLKDF